MDEIDRLKEQEKQKAKATHYPEYHVVHEKSIAFPLLLILAGGFFLLQNLGYFSFDNWWALFILWPAVHHVEKGWRRWHHGGRLTRRVRRHFWIAAAFTFISAIFLFNLSINWHIIWPVILIGWGVMAVLKGFDRA